MTVPAARGPRRPAVRTPHPALAATPHVTAASPATAATAAVPEARRPAEDGVPESVSPRDRAILMAVAAGRCTMNPDAAEGLLVDGRPCSDQFAGHRLVRAGLARLIAQPPGRPCTVALSPAAVSLLGLPITL